MGAAVARISEIHKSIGHLCTLVLEEWKWDAIPLTELPRLISFCEQRSAMYAAKKDSARALVMQWEWRKRAEALLEVLKEKRNP